MSTGPKGSGGEATAPRLADFGAPVPLRIDLPPMLLKVLASAVDPESRARLTELFVAADRAIHALGEIDLRSYEPSGGESADLSAWEDMAPVIATTISEVNTLLSTVSERFPEPVDDTTDLDDMDFFGGTFDEEQTEERDPTQGPKSDPDARVQDAISAIHGISAVLRMEVAAFGQTIRKPQVMADRWNLVDALEAFRGKFRAGVGELVFSAACSLADVNKEDVVPGYRQDIDKSVGLRRALALLAPSVAKENTAAQAAESNDGYTTRRHAGRVMKLLERFVTSRAWKTLRAADRQSVTKLRRALETLVADPSCFPSDIRKTIEGLDRFLESMAVINHREVLVLHDRVALPGFADAMRSALRAASDGEDSAARLLFSDAMETGWRLVGRDPELDEVLFRARKVDIAELDAEDVAFWAESLLERVEAIPLP